MQNLLTSASSFASCMVHFTGVSARLNMKYTLERVSGSGNDTEYPSQGTLAIQSTNQNLKQIYVADTKRGKPRASESRLVSFGFTSDWSRIKVS